MIFAAVKFALTRSGAHGPSHPVYEAERLIQRGKLAEAKRFLDTDDQGEVIALLEAGKPHHALAELEQHLTTRNVERINEVYALTLTGQQELFL